MRELLTPLALTVTYVGEGMPRPYIQVERTGGAADLDDLEDRPTMRVRVVHESRGEAWELAQNVRKVIADSPGQYLTSGLIDFVREVTSNAQVPVFITADDREITSTYSLTTRHVRE